MFAEERLGMSYSLVCIEVLCAMTHQCNTKINKRSLDKITGVASVIQP